MLYRFLNKKVKLLTKSGKEWIIGTVIDCDNNFIVINQVKKDGSIQEKLISYSDIAQLIVR